jgi:hypothetical protein
MNRLMGEKLGNYLLSSEMSSLSLTFDTFDDERDYDLLLENLRRDFVPLLGEENTLWLLEAVKRTPGQGS